VGESKEQFLFDPGRGLLLQGVAGPGSRIPEKRGKNVEKRGQNVNVLSLPGSQWTKKGGWPCGLARKMQRWVLG